MIRSAATSACRLPCSRSAAIGNTDRNSSNENSRPITAPICATSLPPASRSSRAISDPCSELGTTTGARRPRCHDIAVGVGRAARQHGLGQLLDEQRHAVRVGDDLIAHRLGQARPAGHAIDQRIGLAPIEPTEGLHGYHRVIDPVGLHVRPRCDHQQQSHMLDLLHDAGQQFQRGGIRPVQVLDDREHRVFVGQPFELSQDRGKGALLASLRGEFRKLCLRGSRQRQQVCDQRELLGRCPCRQQCRELAQFRRGIVLALEAGGAGELGDHRMQQRVLVMRRTQVAPPGMRLRQEAIFQRGSEARLADAGLAAEQHDAAFASLRLAPAMQQQCEFVFATEQRCAAAGAQRLETTVDRALAQHAPDRGPAARSP